MRRGQGKSGRGRDEAVLRVGGAKHTHTRPWSTALRAAPPVAPTRPRPRHHGCPVRAGGHDARRLPRLPQIQTAPCPLRLSQFVSPQSIPTSLHHGLPHRAATLCSSPAPSSAPSLHRAAQPTRASPVSFASRVHPPLSCAPHTTTMLPLFLAPFALPHLAPPHRAPPCPCVFTPVAPPTLPVRMLYRANPPCACAPVAPLTLPVRMLYSTTRPPPSRSCMDR